MIEQAEKLDLNTQLLYLSLLQEKVALLRSLAVLETRIEVFETAFKTEGEHYAGPSH